MSSSALSVNSKSINQRQYIQFFSTVGIDLEIRRMSICSARNNRIIHGSNLLLIQIKILTAPKNRTSSVLTGFYGSIVGYRYIEIPSILRSNRSIDQRILGIANHSTVLSSKQDRRVRHSFRFIRNTTEYRGGLIGSMRRIRTVSILHTQYRLTLQPFSSRSKHDSLSTAKPRRKSNLLIRNVELFTEIQERLGVSRSQVLRRSRINRRNDVRRITLLQYKDDLVLGKVHGTYLHRERPFMPSNLLSLGTRPEIFVDIDLLVVYGRTKQRHVD